MFITFNTYMDLDGAKNGLKLQGFLIFVTNCYGMGKENMYPLVYEFVSYWTTMGELHVDSLIGWWYRAGLKLHHFRRFWMEVITDSYYFIEHRRIIIHFKMCSCMAIYSVALQNSDR